MKISFVNINKIPNPNESTVEYVKIFCTAEERALLVSEIAERNRRNRDARIESENEEA
jgi:hypothetical protein